MHESIQSSNELVLKVAGVPLKDKIIPFIEETPTELWEFISLHTDPSPAITNIVELNSIEEINALDTKGCNNLVNLQRINDIRHLNSFFKSVNSCLPGNGIFISRVETIEQRKERIFGKYNPLYARIFYKIDFIYKRIIPKWKPTRKIYFALTKGRNRVLSRTETLGRLISSGFEILALSEIGNHLYFAAQKTGAPLLTGKPTNGIIVSLPRSGKDGKPIKVYKLRTMHPYAEYVQEYLFKLNNLKNGGKFNKDFRVTSWGRFLRKYWIDELPMIYNLIKGDIKLVGVRPLSTQYLGLYPAEHTARRQKYKPGLIPPYYADLPDTLPEIIKSEADYFDQYDKHPFLTDLKYLWRVFKNIGLKRARSS
jgi:lipopolysaccharide/colanic/teichoic acid biosynthesis glycosyltransferase